MRIGIFLNIVGTLAHGPVWGEEVIAQGLKEYLSLQPSVEFVECFGTQGDPSIADAPNDFDVVVHCAPLLPMEYSKTNVIMYEISDMYRDGGIHYYDRYDWCFSYGRTFSAWNDRSSWFPPPVDTYVFDRVQSDEYDCDVFFAGNTHGCGLEENIIQPAVDACSNALIFGCLGNSPLPAHLLPRLYSSGKIGINRHHPDHIYFDMWNNRTVELLSCGAFVISDAVPVEQEVFGDSIVISTGGDDLRDKIKYYLENPAERYSRAQKGRDIVRAQFSTKDASERMLARLSCILGA